MLRVVCPKGWGVGWRGQMLKAGLTGFCDHQWEAVGTSMEKNQSRVGRKCLQS